MEQRPRRTTSPPMPEQSAFTMFVLRAWMWVAPIAIIVASAVFSTIAVLDERWALLAVMLVMGVFGVALLLLHWWLLYRFGAQR
jgi:hypothetical protein